MTATVVVVPKFLLTALSGWEVASPFSSSLLQ